MPDCSGDVNDVHEPLEWWYNRMAVMPDTLSRPIVLSEDLYLALLRENPDLCLERSKHGELIVVPPAGAAGSAANADLSTQLAIWCRKHGGIVFDSSAGFRLPDGATRSPDAAWLDGSRWTALTPAQRRGFPPLCPDFVAELLSPSDDLDEIRAKMAEYLANGARLGWLLDPFRRAIEIYRPGREPEIREGAHTVDGEDVLPGFVLDLDPIFALAT